MTRMEEPLLQIAMLCYMAGVVGYAIRLAQNSTRTGWVASACAALGLVLHTASIVSRGISAGHAPVVSMYEYLVAFAWMVVLAYLVFERRSPAPVQGAGALALLVAVGLLGYASNLPSHLKQPEALMPVLKSNWLVFHVSVAVVGYAAATLATALAALYFLSAHAQRRQVRWLLARLPAAPVLDQAVYRCVRFAFPFLTLVNVTGAVWAFNAWGRYWGWDPKETWSLITWITFTFYLHARLRAGWRAPQVNAVVLVGLATIMFTFLGVNQLASFSDSLHSYAAGN